MKYILHLINILHALAGVYILLKGFGNNYDTNIIVRILLSTPLFLLAYFAWRSLQTGATTRGTILTLLPEILILIGIILFIFTNKRWN